MSLVPEHLLFKVYLIYWLRMHLMIDEVEKLTKSDRSLHRRIESLEKGVLKHIRDTYKVEIELYSEISNEACAKSNRVLNQYGRDLTIVKLQDYEKRVADEIYRGGDSSGAEVGGKDITDV